jgi:hypothetical protein
VLRHNTRHESLSAQHDARPIRRVEVADVENRHDSITVVRRADVLAGQVIFERCAHVVDVMLGARVRDVA